MAAAALAYLILHQQDSVGLVTFDDQVRAVSSSRRASRRTSSRSSSPEPGARPRAKTRLAPIFHDLAERITRRGIIIVLSDLFDEPADFLAGLQAPAAQAARGRRLARARRGRAGVSRSRKRRCSAAWNSIPSC